tara:strand:- start:177 stop:356 length:180 start_codon:yes stop_codon:yes gene_type:complete
MDQKYNVSDILSAVEEINSLKPIKKIADSNNQKLKKILKEEIPASTLKLIEEAENNLKN